MRTRMDDYLADYGYHTTEPGRRIAESPRRPKPASRLVRWLPRADLGDGRAKDDWISRKRRALRARRAFLGRLPLPWWRKR